MKLIVAIVRPERLNAVLSALNGREVCLLAVSDVVAAGRGRRQIYRDREVAGPQALLRVEVASNDDAADEAVEAITCAHGPGQTGGKVFVVRLEEYADLNNERLKPAAVGSGKAHKRSLTMDREIMP
jgi:nitrogen regulatory protein P-II 2